MTRSASPTRDGSSCQMSVRIPATGRLGAGNALATTPDGASRPRSLPPGGRRVAGARQKRARAEETADPSFLSAAGRVRTAPANTAAKRIEDDAR